MILNKKTIALMLLIVGLGSTYKAQSYTHQYKNEAGYAVEIYTTYYSCKSDRFILGVDGKKSIGVGSCSLNKCHAKVYDPKGDQQEVVEISTKDRVRFEAMGILEQVQKPRRYFNAVPYNPPVGWAGTGTIVVKPFATGYKVVRQ